MDKQVVAYEKCATYKEFSVINWDMALIQNNLLFRIRQN